MKLGEVLTLDKKNTISIEDDKEYIIAGMQSYGKGVANKRKEKGSDMKMKKYQVIKPNQLMWCKVDTKNGAFGVTKEENVGSLASTNMALADIDTEKVNPKFLQLLFTMPYFYNYINKLCTGTTNRKYLKVSEVLEKIEIPKLSVEEQNSIIEQYYNIEEFKNELSKEVDKQEFYIRKLKESILQEAVKGKLVEQYEKDEPASVLLERIREEKGRLVKDKVIKKEKALPEIGENEVPYELPRGWEICKLGKIAFITKLAGFEYTKYIKLNDSGEVPVLRAQNIRMINIDKTNLKYIDYQTSLDLHRSALTKRCLVMTFIGAGIGDVALFNEEPRYHLAPNVAKIELYTQDIDEKYLLYYLISPIGKKEIFKHLKATAQPSLSMQTIRDANIILPSLSEQRRIVEKIDLLMKVCEELKNKIEKSKEYSEKLMESILKNSFEA